MTFVPISRSLLTILVVALVGCVSTARRGSEIALGGSESKKVEMELSVSAEDSSKPGDPLHLLGEDLDAYREVESKHGRLEVEGPRKYRKLIEQLASAGGKTLEVAEEELGVVSGNTLRLVLIPIEAENWPSHFTAKSKMVENRMTIPVIFDSDVDSLAEFLVDENFFSQGFAGHEHFEFSICMGSGNLRVSLDPGIDWYGIAIQTKSYTRWFRDGFANYAAYVWLNRLNDHAGVLPENRIAFAHEDGAEDALEKIGARIFNWHQFRKNGNHIRYAASMGLFLKLEEEYGREKIRDWNKAIENSTDRFKVRRDLLRSAKDVFGVSLRKLARTAEGHVDSATRSPKEAAKMSASAGGQVVQAISAMNN